MLFSLEFVKFTASEIAPFWKEFGLCFEEIGHEFLNVLDHEFNNEKKKHFT